MLYQHLVPGKHGQLDSSTKTVRLVLGALAAVAGMLGLAGCGGGTGGGLNSSFNDQPFPTTPTPVPGATPTQQSSQIVFDSNRTGDFQLYSVNANGAGMKRLTADAGTTKRDNTLPVFNAARTKIAYVSRSLPSGSPNIFIMDADGSNQKQLTSNGGYAPSFSPDGSQVVFVKGNSIAVMDSDGNHVKVLTTAGSNETVSDPSYSPDGKTIVFSSGTVGQFGAFLSLYLMDADGTHKRQLKIQTAGPTNTHARFSPDGHKILFQTDLGRNSFNQISVVNADGSNAKTVINDTKFFYNQPAWSPDGSKIIFASNRVGGRYHLYTANADGSHITPVTSGPGDDKDPDWKGGN